MEKDMHLIYQQAQEAFDVFNQENVPDKSVEGAKQRLTAFLACLDYLIYRYPDTKFPFKLYRVRQEAAIPEDESIREACTFSYPAPEKCRIARANKDGCPVFYVADSIDVAVKEASCKAGEVIYLSEWYLSHPKDAGFFLFFNEPLPENSFWRKAQIHQQAILQQRLQCMHEKTGKQWQQIYQLYYQAFMGENYQVSSIIGHYLLYESGPADIQLLVYPSKVHDGPGFNLAIHPDFVDKHLHLRRVFKLRITGDKPNITTHALSVGDMANGTVVWRSPLDHEQKPELIKY